MTPNTGRHPNWELRLAVLEDVEAHPGTQTGMVARRTGLTEWQVRNQVRKLEAAGLLKRNPTTGSNTRIWPTGIETDDEIERALRKGLQEDSE